MAGLRGLALERRERLAGSLLLGVLLRPPGALADLLAVDHRRAREPPLVRGSLDLEHRVRDLALPARELLLELRLVVDVLRRRVVDLLRERGDDRRRDVLEAPLEVDRGQRRLEQRSQDVAVADEAVELVARESGPAHGEHRPELEL